MISQEKSSIDKDSEMAEMEALANCISDFIKDNKEKPSLAGLDLEEESVRGRRVKEREDLWFIGQWACHKYDYPGPADVVCPGKWTGQTDDWYFVASWSIGNVDVLVRIEKSEDGKYIVADWDVIVID